jgi:group I intron endonuclease
MSSIYTIYSAKCVVTEQRYIGFDSNWPKRKTAHKREHKKQKYNTKFYNAIRKYGWDSFIWEVIYQSKETVSPKDSHTLNTMENYFICEYNSYHNGYNMTEGGDCGPILLGNKNGMFGKTHNIEIRNKASEYATKRFKGKSYEELYGKEKADKLKSQRASQWLNKDNSFVNNPRFDKTEYNFFNIKTGELLICNQWVFYKNKNLSKASTSEIVNKGTSRRNWIVLYN